MRQHYFVAPAGTVSPRWVEAYEDALVITQLPPVMDADTTVWLHTALPGWADWVGPVLACEGRVIILSSAPRREELIMALGAGARGYVHALSSVSILRQIDEVLDRGGIWIGSDLVALLAEQVAPQVDTRVSTMQNVMHSLTEREREVALAVANGQSNKEIARQLGITERTVKAHLSGIFNKLDVRDRLQLVLRVKGQN